MARPSEVELREPRRDADVARVALDLTVDAGLTMGRVTAAADVHGVAADVRSGFRSPAGRGEPAERQQTAHARDCGYALELHVTLLSGRDEPFASCDRSELTATWLAMRPWGCRAGGWFNPYFDDTTR